ncbi:MAG TPA: hypothetical protein PL193_14285 [Xanthobacteraceae bacterium]|nr:hypothetical protein [Xanthobacteraceae bacterium]
MSIVAIISFPAFSQGTSKHSAFLAAVDDTQFETTACLAYYYHGKQCFFARLPADRKKDHETTITVLTSRAFELGSKLGMTEDAMLSRLKIKLEEQRSLMSGSCTNFDSLFARHAQRCKQITEDPESLLKEYLEKHLRTNN